MKEGGKKSFAPGRGVRRPDVVVTLDLGGCTGVESGMGLGIVNLGVGVRYEGRNISYRLVFWPWKSATY